MFWLVMQLATYNGIAISEMALVISFLLQRKIGTVRLFPYSLGKEEQREEKKTINTRRSNTFLFRAKNEQV